MAMVRRQGFTLIELLVVISVIGILVSILAASFSTGQKRSRDAKRREDAAAVQKALEQCYSLASVYPAAVTSGNSLSCSSQTTMNLVPSDPKNSGSYIYTYSTDAARSSYCYCAFLEQTSSGNATTAGANGSCNFSQGGNYQCVSSQQ